MLGTILSLIVIPIMIIVYVWVSYNAPVLAFGVYHSRRKRKAEESSSKAFKPNEIPSFSIIVPVKDEETVIGRLLDAALKINYPRDKLEVIIVEDGSSDRTIDICMKYAEKHLGFIKFFHREPSGGKPSALNYGLKMAKGEILAFFDADNVPSPDILQK